MSKPATVAIHLRPEPGWNGDPDRRLAQALKCLLRSFGWRCVNVEPIRQEAAPDSQDRDQGNADGAGGIGDA